MANDIPAFAPWSLQHLIVLLILAVTASVAVWIGRSAEAPGGASSSSPSRGARAPGVASSKSGRRKGWLHRSVSVLNWGLATLLVGSEIAAAAYSVQRGEWSVASGLPLQICDISVYAVALALLTRHQASYELAYFWGLGGTIHGLITPDLLVGFPHPACLKFFVTHVGIVVSVVYLSAGLGLRPAAGSVQRMFIVTNGYAAVVGCINWALGTNYLYLCRKPSAPSLLDYLGPWPWYIVGLEVAAIVSFLVCYVPFWAIDRRRYHERW